jgi:adenylyl cyclase-associated protein
MEDTVKRLEIVTSRLEALEARLSGTGGAKPSAGASSSSSQSQADAAFVTAFDRLLSDSFSPVEKGAKNLSSPDVESIISAFKDALQAQRGMLVIASRCKKPSEGDLQKVLKPTSDAMAKVDSLKDRRSKLFNHLAMVAEGVACLQWVCVEPTPAPFLGDVIPGSEMYGNKVIMEFKGKDENHVNFAKDFKTFLVELQKYVKANHTTGLSWNPSGGTGKNTQKYHTVSFCSLPCFTALKYSCLARLLGCKRQHFWPFKCASSTKRCTSSWTSSSSSSWLFQ